MPANDGIRLDDDQSVTPLREPATSQDPKPAIGVAKPWPGLPAPENDQLLPKVQILSDQSEFGFEEGGEGVGKLPKHRTGL